MRSSRPGCPAKRGRKRGQGVKGSVLDIDRLSAQSHSTYMARKLRVEFAGAHHECIRAVNLSITHKFLSLVTCQDGYH
jgi:hypothetical protein